MKTLRTASLGSNFTGSYKKENVNQFSEPGDIFFGTMYLPRYYDASKGLILPKLTVSWGRAQHFIKSVQ